MRRRNFPFDIDREFEMLRRHLDNLFNFMRLEEDYDYDYETPLLPTNSNLPIDRSDFKVPIADMYETDKEVIIQVEVPGVDKKDIQLEVNENKLVLKAEKKEEQENKDDKKGYYRVERKYNSYYRTFPLPEDVETDKIKASYNNGVLEIHIPKVESEQKKGKFIKID